MTTYRKNGANVCDKCDKVEGRSKIPEKLVTFMEAALFELVCLPFGLCTAPYIFTKILKSVTNVLRVDGFLSVVYSDDWLCFGKNYNQCLEN